ncbi:MAG: RNA-guided endonuclease TnpB family protein [Oscillatoriaceae cyanobacterium Prado104]|jgi:putative transposase|nr:RNA-guided endonuclease TnpB family protein [Oscillatoriaceae cyanobacterium Prado104]
MYAIKLELKLKDRKRTLMALYSCDARFCYNLALAIARSVKDPQVSSSKKVVAIARVFANRIQKLLQEPETKTRASRVDKIMNFWHFSEALSRFFKVLGGQHKLNRKKDSNLFTVEAANGNREILLEDSKLIKFPSLGTFKLNKAIPLKCRAQASSSSRAMDKWYVSFAIKAEKVPPLLHPVTEPAGIDWRGAIFATLSDSNCYESPLQLAKVKTKLSQTRWRNRNKQLGSRQLDVKASKNARKHYGRSAKIHAKTAKGNREFLQKSRTEISKKTAGIRREDLQASWTIAGRNLAAAISDCGFSELRCQLVYKSSMYDTTVELVARWYPSSKTSSNCGRIRSMPLKERVCECQHWGAIINSGIQVATDLARHEAARKAWQGRSVRACEQEGVGSLAKSCSRTLDLLGVDLSKFHTKANSSRSENNY